jgi:hypothetical protein
MRLRGGRGRRRQHHRPGADRSGAFFPIFPLRLGASSIFARELIASTSDVKAWPFWTITGPGSAITIENTTTGKSLTWGGTLGDSEILYIDTRPRELSTDPKSVRDTTATWRFSELEWPSDFWPLEPGVNSVRIEMAGATTSSSVRAQWLPRFLGA